MAIPSDTPIPLIDSPLIDNRTQLGYHMFMDTDGRPDPMSSDFMDALWDLTYFQFVTLNDATAFRPDAVAQVFYGNAQLFWVIMAYNGVSDVTQMVSGMTIRIPEKTRLFELLSKIAKRTDGRSVTRTVSL